jgi:hypothetical protein
MSMNAVMTTFWPEPEASSVIALRFLKPREDVGDAVAS